MRTHFGQTAFAIVCLILLPACETKTRPGGAGPIAPSEPAGPGLGNPGAPPALPPASSSGGKRLVPAWPFWPEKMRIHPLTRLVDDVHTGQRLLETRVEFTDAWGATTKASGQLTLRLFADVNALDSAEPLETWNVNLRDLDVNAQQYDDVTRTYLMRLQLDPAKLTPQPDLRAYFVSANGALLSHTLRIDR